MITAIVREEEESGPIWERGIIVSSEQDSGKGWVIIKNILINFLDLFFRFIEYLFSFFLVTRHTQRHRRNLPTTRH